MHVPLNVILFSRLLNHLRLLPESASGQGCVLAPALFCILCIAIDWILSSCTGNMGTTVGSSKFTDQDYADDAVLLSDCPSKWPHILSSFDEAAHTMGLNTGRLKSREWTSRHEEAAVDIARVDNVARRSKGGQRGSGQGGTKKQGWTTQE